MRVRGGCTFDGLSRTSIDACAVWPSCQRNSRVRRKGVGCLNSQRTTEFHWLSSSGRSRCERIHPWKAGYMIVSDVGRIAIGCSISPSPDLVTHATSGAKPSTCSFSALSFASDTNIGK